MGQFTFVPIWVIEDLLIYLVGIVTVLYILKCEEQPVSRLFELFAFCACYAAVYENFATLMGWYGYGRSLLMIFNVPASVPLVEYLVVYATLRLLDGTTMPPWAKPFVVGLSGIVFDFSLDPVALRQVFATREGRIGRWSWFPGPADAQLYGEPVYNFSGWVLLCGFAAAAFLLGREWHRRSGYKWSVGIVYPFAAMLAALAVLVSPLSRFLLWLWPFMDKGSAAEWIMLAADGGIGLIFLALFFRRKKGRAFSFGAEPTVYLILALLPATNLIACIGGGFWDVLWLVALAVFLEAGFVMAAGKPRRRSLATGA